MTTYRLDRAPAMAIAGSLVVAAAVAGFLAFLLSSTPGVVLGVLTVLLLIAAVLVVARPPVLARLDEHGIRTRRARERWTDVEDVKVNDGLVLLALGPEGDGQRVLRLTLASFGRRAPELLRELYDRLNTAHGYRRFE